MSCHVWILGLRDFYRGQKLEEQLKFQNLDFSNFWGFNGNKDLNLIKDNNINQKFPGFIYGRDLLPTEVAASLGHIAIYQELLNSPNEWALILEDDAQIAPKLMEFISKLIDYKKPAVITLNSGAGFRFYKLSIIPRGLHKKIVEISRLLELPSLAHGYLVNKQAVLMMDFGKMKNLISVADWPYIWPSSFEYYMTKINYVSVGDKNSTSLIGDRESLASASPSYWMPSINRLMTAHKFGISFKQAFYREVWIKILRFCYRMLNLVRGRY